MFLGAFCKLNKIPSDGTCLGEPPGDFCDVGCCRCFTLLEVFLPPLLFDAVPHTSVSYCQVFTPILYFQLSSSQSDLWHFHITFLSFSVTALPRVVVLSRHFLPTGASYLALLPHILARFVTQVRAGTPHSGSSSAPSLTELPFPADTWCWATHVVDTRPLVYQLRQWATEYKVTNLLNMFQPNYACSKSNGKDYKQDLLISAA